jgi:hypothetical protein
MKTHHVLGLLGALGLALVATPALADDAKGGPHKDHPKAEEAKAKAEEKKEEAKEKVDAAKDAAKDKVEEAKDKVDADLKDLKDDWKKKRAEWVEKRKERRDQVKDELKKKYGDELKAPAVKEELKHHARRVARLERIIFLAEATDKKKVVEKAQEALKKENERHEKHMETLKTAGDKKMDDKKPEGEKK